MTQLLNTSMLSNKNYYKKYYPKSHFYINNIDNIISISKDTDLNLIEKLKIKNCIKDFELLCLFYNSNKIYFIDNNNFLIFKAKDDYYFVLIYIDNYYHAYKLDQINELIKFLKKINNDITRTV